MILKKAGHILLTNGTETLLFKLQDLYEHYFIGYRDRSQLSKLHPITILYNLAMGSNVFHFDSTLLREGGGQCNPLVQLCYFLLFASLFFSSHKGLTKPTPRANPSPSFEDFHQSMDRATYPSGTVRC